MLSTVTKNLGSSNFWDGPTTGYVRICYDPLTHGGNLEPILAHKMFFGLILQQFCDFSGTWELRN